MTLRHWTGKYHHNDFEATLASLKPAGRPTMTNDDWRPIETAPGDQRAILCFNQVMGVFIARKWDEHDYTCIDWNGVSGKWYPKPTHWMPLPEPPEEAPR